MRTDSGIRSITLVIIAAAAPALAQTDLQPLAGPKVTESKVPGVQEKFSDGAKGFNDKNGPRGLPPEAIRKALRAVEREDAPADIRLTDDQRAQVRRLVAEFESAVRDYKRAHKNELESLRRDQARPAAKAGKDSAETPEKAADDAMTDQARASAEELRRNASSPAGLQTRIWGILSEPQREFVQAEATKIMREREEVKAREYVRKRMAKDGPARTDKARPADFDPDNLPPRLKERLANLSPQERQRAVERLRERAKKAGASGTRPPAGSDKPAPSMDQVEVPSPDRSSPR